MTSESTLALTSITSNLRSGIRSSPCAQYARKAALPCTVPAGSSVSRTIIGELNVTSSW